MHVEEMLSQEEPMDNEQMDKIIEQRVQQFWDRVKVLKMM